MRWVQAVVVRLLAALVLLCVTGAGPDDAPPPAEPPPPTAPPPVRFGLVGQNVVFGTVGFDLTLGDEVNADPNGWYAWDRRRDISFDLRPGWLRFIAQDVALGVALDVGYADLELRFLPRQQWRIGGQIVGAVNVPLSPHFSLFPVLFVGGGYAWYRDAPLTYVTYGDPAPVYLLAGLAKPDGPYFSTSLALLLHVYLRPLLYVGVGPRLDLQYGPMEQDSFIRLGLNMAMGGAF